MGQKDAEYPAVGEPAEGQTIIAQARGSEPKWRTFTKFCAVLVNAIGGSWILTNQKSTLEEIGAVTRNRSTQDLTYCTQFRLMSNIVTIGNFVKASGTVTCVGVLAGDTVTVNGLIYTAVAGAKADDTEFSIDVDDNTCATDLADSIDDDTRTGTVDDLTSTATTNVVTSVSTVAGTGGNATAQTSSNGTRLAVTALFTLGLEANLGIQYSTDGGTNWFGLDNGTADTISTVINLMGALGHIKTAWANLTTNAKADVLIRLVTIDGDGAVDPSISIVEVQFR